MCKLLHATSCTKMMIYPQRKPKRSLPQTHCLATTDTTVLFDYIDLYTKYICIHDAQQCLSSAFVPPLQEQIKIVQHFNTITHELGNVHDLQGVLLKLIITHNDQAVESLTEQLEQYNNSIAVLHAIVDYTNTVSLPSNELEVSL